jgi:ornithine decarboxylase
MKTPVLFIDKSRVRQAYHDLRAAFPSFRVCYAIKSNSHRGIIEILKKEGSHFETASLGEIHYLKSLEISSGKIIFSNPVKAPDMILGSLGEGVQIMSFDAVEELEKFLPYRDSTKLLLRISVPNEGSLWPLTGKFGAPEYLWDGIFKYIKRNELNLYGITFHPGSQGEFLGAWDSAMRVAWRCIREARDVYDLDLVCLNIGGGFPIDLGRTIPSIQQIADVVHEHLDSWAHHEEFRPQDLICEPGRFISGPAGYLVSTVVGVARRERNWVFLDSGVFCGMMETIDGITYPMKFTGEGDLERVILCGPSCDSVDKMFDTDLPSPKTGDMVLFQGAGAYTTVYASNFNGFRPPGVCQHSCPLFHAA